MKRRFTALLTWFLSVLLGTTLFAQNVAYELAYSAIGGNIHLQSDEDKSVASDSEYLIYVNDEHSFAIVSADGKHLLGYGVDANASDDMPPALSFFLGKYKQANHTYNLNKSAVTAISPLVKTKWNQSWPYNNLCPSQESGELCVTGCVATAMAQVLKYHEYPSKTTKKIPSYVTNSLGKTVDSVPFGTTISWSDMKDEYSFEYDRSNEKACNAVAELMLYCGTSVKMDYGPSSGAYGFAVPTALINYYGYQNLRYEFRDAFAKDDWYDLVFGELKASRPVLYCGSSPDGGHAFIFDGVDSNGFVHVNWGWGGQLDGYFDMEVLDPDDSGQIGAGGNGGYVSQGQILCNVERPGGTASQSHNTIWSPYVPILWDGEMSYVEKENGKYTINVAVYFYHEYYDYNESYVTIGWKNSDGTFHPDEDTYVEDNGEGLYGVGYSFSVDESDFDSDGMLSIYMLEKKIKSDNYQLAGNAERNKIQLKCEGGRVFQYVDSSTRTIVTIPEKDTTEFVYNGEKQKYHIPESTQYTVSGNVEVNAGEYDVIVSLVDNLTTGWSDNTIADKVYNFVIKKAVPNVVAPSEVFLAVLGQRAEDVKLPQGFEWEDPKFVFDELGYHTLTCTYIPDDTRNYEIVENLPVQVYVRSGVFSEVQLTEEQSVWGVPNGGYLEFDCNMDGFVYELFDIVVEDKHYAGELSADGLLRFKLPKSIKAGVYMTTMEIQFIEGSERRIVDIDVKFKVNYPSSYITTLWNDVLAVKNGSYIFSTYQWYKDKMLLEGQRRQYLPLKAGDEGEYTCKVYNSQGVELFITPVTYKYESAFEVKVSPNPANVNEQLTITLSGLSSDDLNNTKLFIHNLNGKIVSTIFEVDKVNYVKLDAGQYIVTVVVNNMKAGASMFVVK